MSLANPSSFRSMPFVSVWYPEFGSFHLSLFCSFRRLEISIPLAWKLFSSAIQNIQYQFLREIDCLYWSLSWAHFPRVGLIRIANWAKSYSSLSVYVQFCIVCVPLRYYLQSIYFSECCPDCDFPFCTPILVCWPLCMCFWEQYANFPVWARAHYTIPAVNSVMTVLCWLILQLPSFIVLTWVTCSILVGNAKKNFRSRNGSCSSLAMLILCYPTRCDDTECLEF